MLEELTQHKGKQQITDLLDKAIETSQEKERKIHYYRHINYRR